MTAGNLRLCLQYQSGLSIRLGYVDEKTHCPSAVAPCGIVIKGKCSVIGQREAGVPSQQLHDSANVAHCPMLLILPHLKHPFLLSYPSLTPLLRNSIMLHHAAPVQPLSFNDNSARVPCPFKS